MKGKGAIGLVMVLAAVGALAVPLGSFESFVKYMATPAAMGAISMALLQVMKRLWPQIEGDVAFYASQLLALIAAVACTRLVPILPQLPPEVEMYWPFAVWFAQQIWYRLFPNPTPAERDSGPSPSPEK